MHIAHQLGLVAEEDYADFAGLSLATLKRFRTERIGPKAIRIGTKRYYRLADIQVCIGSEPKPDLFLVGGRT
jgi:hypothetical protein